MTDVPACSVVVPTYERPDALRGCLESLAALDYPRERYEVVVVDDGGRKPLGEVLAPAQEQMRVELVAQPHGGPGAARNAGVAHAGGELIAFTDDDCRPRPDWLRRLADRFRAAPEEATGGCTVNALGRNPYSHAAQLVIDVGYRQNNEGPANRRWFTTNNLAVPVTGFRAVGGFDPSFRTAEDRDFCSRWTAHGLRMEYEPRAVVAHAHDLTLGSFAQVHFAYGRGSLRHRRKQRRCGRPVPVEPSFYVTLTREAGRAGLLAPLLLWHVTHTAGFAWEWARTRAAR